MTGSDTYALSPLLGSSNQPCKSQQDAFDVRSYSAMQHPSSTLDLLRFRRVDEVLDQAAGASVAPEFYSTNARERLTTSDSHVVQQASLYSEKTETFSLVACTDRRRSPFLYVTLFLHRSTRHRHGRHATRLFSARSHHRPHTSFICSIRI